MITLVNDIIELLQNADLGVSVPTDNIVGEYPSEVPTFTKPYIVVSEISNLVNERTYTDSEQYSDLTYQIEIYGVVQKIEGEYYTAGETVRYIGRKVVEAMAGYGFTRTSFPAEIPYTYDDSVKRLILTFTGTIDLTHEVIYKE